MLQEMNWLIIALFLPFIGFLINALIGQKMSKNLSGWIGTLAVATPFVLLLTYIYQNPELKPLYIKLCDWIDLGATNISFSLQLDRLSIIMMLIITGIGSLIHLYSISYMHHDVGFSRYFSYLNLFIFFMLILVLSGNYLGMFIGWEGVGLCSYLLIGFWFKNENYNNAAKKAFIMNRVGDLGFLIGIFFILFHFNTLEFNILIEAVHGGALPSKAIIELICILLFVGAMGKSAQIPLFTWLPDAMAGPTPVSALIHAATMVTAGVYMVVRSNFLYNMSPIALQFIAIIGIATALLAATIGLKQTDIKKVLAYSTVSQLGLMFLALGVGA